MTTPILIRGWEHGLATLSTNGGGLVDTIAGATITVQGTIKRTGGYAIRFNKTAAGNCYVVKAVATPNLVVGSLYVYFTTFPATNDDDICFCNVTAGVTLGLKIDTATKKLFARFWGAADGNTADLALSADTWYRIDYKFDVSANPSKIDFQVAEDGGSPVAATQSTYAQAATTFTYVGIGSTNANTSDWYADDEIYSITGDDYPIGAHAVEGLRPSGDGVHNNAADIMEDAAGNDIGDGTGGTVAAWDKLDENPWVDGANDYVRQTANGTGNYCEIVFADTSNTTILGAFALLQYYSASATGNNGGCIIIDEDATATTLWGAPGALADYSESSRYYKSVLLPVPAGGWDQGAVNALKCRFGYSGDANPDPYWQAIMLEVAYVPATGATNIAPAENTQAQVSDAAVAIPIYVIAPAEGTQAQLSDAVSLTIVYPTYNITPAENLQSQVSDAGQAKVIYPLTAGENTQAQASDAAALKAVYIVAPAENTQAQVSDAASISSAINIDPAENSQAQTSDAATLKAVYLLTAGEGAQAQVSDACSVSFSAPGEATPITPAENAQSQVSDAAAVKAVYLITAGEAAQTQTSDPAGIKAVYKLAAGEATQAQTSDAPSLTAYAPIYTIAPAENYQAQAMDVITAYSIYLLVLAKMAQTQVSDAGVISILATFEHGARPLYAIDVRSDSVFDSRPTLETGTRTNLKVVGSR